MSGYKRLNIPIEPELHKMLKVKAAQEGKTLTEIVRDAIVKEVDYDSVPNQLALHWTQEDDT